MTAAERKVDLPVPVYCFETVLCLAVMEMSQEAQMFIEAMTSNEDKYASTAPSFTSNSEPTDAASDKKSTSSSQKPMHNSARLDDDLLPGVRFVVNRFTLYETKTVRILRVCI